MNDSNGLRRATFCAQKGSQKQRQKVASKNPKPKGKLLPTSTLATSFKFMQSTARHALHVESECNLPMWHQLT